MSVTPTVQDMSLTLGSPSPSGSDSGAARRSRGSRSAGPLLAIGIVLILGSVIGWIATSFVSSMAASGESGREDLTVQFHEAGPTPLGQPATVTLRAGQTAVAYLIGTGLHGTAGTTTGTCHARDEQNQSVAVTSNVFIETSVSDVLKAGQELVAVGGVSTDHDVTLSITCDTSDSGVDHFVAVPTNAGTVATPPSWSPTAWIVAGLLGTALITAAFPRLGRDLGEAEARLANRPDGSDDGSA